MLTDYDISTASSDKNENIRDDLQEVKNLNGSTISENLLKFVTQTALELLKPLAYNEIMSVIADRLHMVLDGAIILVSEFDPEGSKLIVREIRAEKDEQEKLESLTGMKIESLSFFFPEEIRKRMQPGTLDLLSDRVYDLVFGQFPIPFCRMIEEQLNIITVYAMACSVDNDILGTIAIMLHTGILPSETIVVIESLVSQASLALKRSRAESSLRESQQRYDSLFQNVTIAIQHCKIITDQEGVPVDYEMFNVNSTFTRLTGIKEEIVYGKKASEVFPQIRQNSFEFIKKLGKVAIEGGELNDEFHISRLNKWFSVYAYSPRKGEFTAFFTDITERKLNETELKKAKAKAEESDRLKTVFLANMSHEIRTPMNGIMGFADLLMQPGLSGESQNRYLEAINLSCRRMLGTINDLVAISKIETGQVELKKTRFDLKSLFAEIISFFQPEAVMKGIHLVLQTDLPDKDFFIETDKTKLYQILSNLIHNSLKFTPHDGTIKFGCKVKNSGELFFFVKDTGIGIKEELKDKIFDRFTQGDMAMIHEGVGLGLAISKAFVELLGGEIGVKSNPGKGSIFYFTLHI